MLSGFLWWLNIQHLETNETKCAKCHVHFLVSFALFPRNVQIFPIDISLFGLNFIQCVRGETATLEWMI